MASRRTNETLQHGVMVWQTTWRPGELAQDRPAYVALADAIAHDLARGLLTPGDRLPTHRALAAELGVTVRTVARGYAEAERRGLVGGEVGRGTYVHAAFGLAPPRSTTVDLSALHPPIAAGAEPAELLAATLRSLAADPVAMHMVTDTERSADHPAHRAAAAQWVARGGFEPTADDLLLTAGAQHAITTCLLALVPAGRMIATTALTNPGLLAAARALSLRLVAVDSDADGMLPAALEDACSREPVAAVHVQPTFHNPSGRTMPTSRREALAELAERHDLWLVEDDPLGPLCLDPPDPLAALVPERTCYIASGAKVLALGLRVGMLAAPPHAYPRLAAALRASTWLTAPLLGEVLARWVRDGVAEQIVQLRIAGCRRRGAQARELLADLDVHGDPGSPHLWIELPSPWSAGSFVAAARDEGILVAPGDDYVVDRTRTAHGIRLGLNAEVPDDQLGQALDALQRLVSLGPTAS
jgi:DNA-binding transcriptional MocR family regulator